MAWSFEANSYLTFFDCRIQLYNVDLESVDPVDQLTGAIQDEAGFPVEFREQLFRVPAQGRQLAEDVRDGIVGEVFQHVDAVIRGDFGHHGVVQTDQRHWLDGPLHHWHPRVVYHRKICFATMNAITYNAVYYYTNIFPSNILIEIHHILFDFKQVTLNSTVPIQQEWPVYLP